jgi:hypothetical protein
LTEGYFQHKLRDGCKGVWAPRGSEPPPTFLLVFALDGILDNGLAQLIPMFLQNNCPRIYSPSQGFRKEFASLTITMGRSPTQSQSCIWEPFIDWVARRGTYPLSRIVIVLITNHTSAGYQYLSQDDIASKTSGSLSDVSDCHRISLFAF